VVLDGVTPSLVPDNIG